MKCLNNLLPKPNNVIVDESIPRHINYLIVYLKGNIRVVVWYFFDKIIQQVLVLWCWECEVIGRSIKRDFVLLESVFWIVSRKTKTILDIDCLVNPLPFIYRSEFIVRIQKSQAFIEHLFLLIMNFGYGWEINTLLSLLVLSGLLSQQTYPRVCLPD